MARPFLELDGLNGLAREIQRVRSGLAARYADRAPTLTELCIALYTHMQQCDERRLSLSNSSSTNFSFSHPSSDSSSAPSPSDLRRYLRVAGAAYGTNEEDMRRRIRLLARDLPQFDVGEPFALRALAGTCAPAFFAVTDHARGEVLVVVRGSQQSADVMTDVMADDVAVTFADAGRRAHHGISVSAAELYGTLRADLTRELRTPGRRLVLVGHSLGAGVATALTLLLRETDHELFQQATCYAFAPPPIMSGAPGLHDRAVTCVVNGWDAVPRLGVHALDKLVHDLATLDYSPSVAGIVGRAAGFVAPPATATFIENSVRSVAESFDAVQVSRAARQASTGWTILEAVTHLIGAGVEGHARRARAQGQGGGQGERARQAYGQGQGGEGEGRYALDEDRRLRLVGTVWHLDRPFQNVTANDRIEPYDAELGTRYHLPRSTLVRRDADFFRELEVSTWMRYDHYVHNMLAQIDSLDGGDSGGDDDGIWILD